jgi:ATP-binding cassette subfamily A (ABC1) protein 3
LLWRRKLGGSLCEVLFPIFIVGALVGIRQAVKNTDYSEGPRIAEGRYYSGNNADFDSPTNFAVDVITNIFDGELLVDGSPVVMPMAFGGRWYTIVGDSPRAEDFRQKVIEPYVATYNSLAPREVTFYEEKFATEEELFKFVRSNVYQRDSNEDALLFAVGVPEEGNDFIIYQSANFPGHIPNTQFDETSTQPDTESSKLYGRNGFLTLQTLIAEFILQEQGTDAHIETFVTMGSIKEFTRDDFMSNIGPTLALFILLIFIAPQFRLVGFITEEKASRAREGMKIMGLNDSPYWISWFIYYIAICFVISVVVSAMFALFLFPHSGFIMLFLYVFLYGMSIFSFSMLVASFLQRPRIACTLATLLHFLTYFMVIPIADPGVAIEVKGAFSFVPNMAMAMATQTIARLEADGIGLTGSSLNTEREGYQVGIAFAWWIIMFFVLLLLALYFDNVLPKEFGKRQHPCFMFSKQYWVGGNNLERRDGHEKLLEEDDEELDGSNRDFEKVPPNFRQQEKSGECLKVRHLKKTYPNGKQAVNDLSLTMYKNQIFALLGHNGAGKTTTLSILTGLYPATDGQASVFNLDMFGQVDQVRKQLGVCPQFDILFDMLTPIEHLKLYCMFKGVPADQVTEEVEKTIRDVDLNSKRTAYAKNLSGGQKRKLSVGIAMIGGSKLVLLDEPTSGMDLTARRRIWDMLKNNKQDRILILTTHFMDEADILGDRIAIMAAGQIKCCGGSLFLKKRFGVGYNLVLAKENKDPNPSIQEFIMERIPAAIKLSEVSSEITFQIPQTESDKFEQFFTDLDQSLSELRIKSYGVGVTTLEEVFLRVGKDGEEENEDQPNVKEMIKKDVEELEKEMEEQKRQLKENTGSYHSINHTGEIEVDEYSIAERSEEDVFWLHFWALSVKRFLVSFRQFKTSLLEIFIPILLIIAGLGMASISFFSDPPYVNLSITNFPTPNDMFISAFPNVPAEQVTAFKNSKVEDFNIEDGVQIPAGNIMEALTFFENDVFPDKGAYDPKIRNSGNQVIYNVGEDQGTRCQVVVFANGFGRDTVALQHLDALRSCLNILTAADQKMDTRVSPFPLTATATAGAQAGSGSIVAFLFAIALAMIPAGVASSIVSERENNVKHQQIISGANLVSYWLSNYAVDIIRCLIPIIVAIVFVFVFSADLPFIWVHFLLFSIAIQPFTYATTFWFKKENVAQTLTILLHIFLGGFLAIAVLVLQSFESTADFARIVRWFPKIVPSYCVVSAIFQISARNILARASGLDFPSDPLSFDVAGGDAMFLGINIVLWWVMLALYENGIIQRLCRCRSPPPEDIRRTENFRIDNDVEAEELR